MDIHKVMVKLAEDRPIFHSEADFQYALSRLLTETYHKANVRLEYPVRLLNDNPKDNRFLDIWIKNKKIAIELKYALKKIDCLHDHEKFSLKSSRIHNFRYGFVEDVKRIEELVWANRIDRGYAIVISNSMNMWSRGQGASEMFSLDTTLKGILTWGTRTRSKKGTIELHGKYPLNWREYKTICDHEFRYLVVEVIRRGRSD